MDDLIERLLAFAGNYTTTTYHEGLIMEAIAEIERLREYERMYKDLEG